MKFIQHIPGAAYWGQKPIEFEFDTVEQLLNHEWIKSFESDDGFFRFSLSADSGRNLLMQERNEGKGWWVVGYLSGPVDLPKWEAKYGD